MTSRGILTHAFMALAAVLLSSRAVLGYRSSSTLLVGGAGSTGDLFSCHINSGSATPCASKKAAVSLRLNLYSTLIVLLLQLFVSGVAVDAGNKRVYYSCKPGH